MVQQFSWKYKKGNIRQKKTVNRQYNHFISLSGAPEPRGHGARGQRNALFCKTIHNCICIKTCVIHKRRLDEVSAKEVAKEFIEINEQRRIYCGQF